MASEQVLIHLGDVTAPRTARTWTRQPQYVEAFAASLISVKRRYESHGGMRMTDLAELAVGQ